MLRKLHLVRFPKPTQLMVNMMPVVMGVPQSVPQELSSYFDLISACRFKKGKTVYLTVNESFVERDGTQRRPGIHTDGTNSIGWGGWGGRAGIYMATTDGHCRAWDTMIHDVDHLGGLDEEPDAPAIVLEPNTLYKISDRTPHESLPAIEPHYRQFFRLVGPDIGAWWAQHSTPNPLGVQPDAPIFEHSKFEA